MFDNSPRIIGYILTCYLISNCKFDLSNLKKFVNSFIDSHLEYKEIGADPLKFVFNWLVRGHVQYLKI